MACKSLYCVLLSICIGGLIKFSKGQSTESDSRYCYQFTWPGEGNATECDDDDDDSPCFNPFVLTEPAYAPPNITALNEHCDNVGCPDYTCSRKGGSCLRWAWYDVEGNMVNYTVFCGLMSDVTMPDKAKVIKEGCFNYLEGSETKESCVCTSFNYCNEGSYATLSIVTVTIGLCFLLCLNRYFE